VRTGFLPFQFGLISSGFRFLDAIQIDTKMNLFFSCNCGEYWQLDVQTIIFYGIGMSLHKSFYQSSTLLSTTKTPNSPWLCRYPNNADFNFNYYHLLNKASHSGLGKINKKNEPRVAVIGLGTAGLLSSRELFRSGFTAIDMFEATNRIGGRTYSVPMKGQYTTFELGAMRMPFFSGQSVLAYLTEEFSISHQDFPNPGSKVANTGIYMNNGYGSDTENPFKSPQLIEWNKGDSSPPNKKLKEVNLLWNNFSTLFSNIASNLYGTKDWTPFWQAVVSRYWNLNFGQLTVLANLNTYDKKNLGDFGGLGMNKEQSELFYTIGAGDGSWGAFYQISCLYPIRTLLFGFGDEHQLIQGNFDNNGAFSAGKEYQQSIADSLGNKLSSPNYLGVQSYAENLLFTEVKSHDETVNNKSLYDAVKSEKHPSINLFTQSKIQKIRKNADKTITVITDNNIEKEYDSIILTVPTWAMQRSIQFEGFSPKDLPFSVQNAFKRSHWITSCKVFYSLKKRYWEDKDIHIPQIISTDTFLQGVYAYAADIKNTKNDIVHKDPGGILISYTWEDDANKFLADKDDDALAKMCLERLDGILLECNHINEKISDYVNLDEPQVIHWSQQPSARGCAKLYRQSSWQDNQELLTYNQNHSANSGLYFAGEAFSLEGGWTEPALRSAIDTVLHIIDHAEGHFLNDFDFAEDYPKYDRWSPEEEPKKKGED